MRIERRVGAGLDTYHGPDVSIVGGFNGRIPDEERLAIGIGLVHLDPARASRVLGQRL